MSPPRMLRVLFALPMLAQTAVAGQSAETVRGRVIDDSSGAVRGPQVTVTRGPDRLVQTALTDSAGQYSSRFDPGTGDYLVYVSALGLKPARRRVQRVASERELIADFTLARDLAMLATVKVVAAKTQQLNVQWQPILPIKVRGRRITSNVMFENPLGGLDQALHGAQNLRGWGTRATPDPVLLVPRGFDATVRRFRYDVNPRFGDTRAFRTLSRQPFRVTLDFSLEFSVPYDVQQLRRAVEPMKVKNGYAPRGVDSIADIYLRNTSNLHRLLLAESDSIFLTPPQIAALIAADSAYSANVRDIYVPMARFLANRQSRVVGKIELDSVQAAPKRYCPLFWDQVDIVERIATPQQKELLPFIRNMMAVAKSERKKQQWSFGYEVPLTPNKPRVGGS